MMLKLAAIVLFLYTFFYCIGAYVMSSVLRFAPAEEYVGFEALPLLYGQEVFISVLFACLGVIGLNVIIQVTSRCQKYHLLFWLVTASVLCLMHVVPLWYVYNPIPGNVIHTPDIPVQPYNL